VTFVVVVATLLQDPPVAVGIGEVGETRVIGAIRIEAGKKATAPTALGVLVPDRADGHSAIGQFCSLGLDIGNDQIQTTDRANRSVGEAHTELNRGG
jgi:hypothetical protein